jgi:hypothetical protein
VKKLKNLALGSGKQCGHRSISLRSRKTLDFVEVEMINYQPGENAGSDGFPPMSLWLLVGKACAKRLLLSTGA